jgi:hypothetical protein
MSTRKNSNIPLRCYAYKGKNADRDGFYAVCIDLSVITWRPTFAEAKKSLNDAICGYIETKVQSENINSLSEFKKLIWRPAAIFPYQFQYFLISMLSKKTSHEGSRRIYNKPINPQSFCHAPA